MRLLIDLGNTRLKWSLEQGGEIFASGAGCLGQSGVLQEIDSVAGQIQSIAVSMVASEAKREQLISVLRRLCAAPIAFYWAEKFRGNLASAYEHVEKMGADRWHAMYAAWLDHRQGFVVIDAGSAVTVDYVSSGGQHLGGFILPGFQMMSRSLQTDAARIGFEPADVTATVPGRNTGECVNHGLAWLFAGMVERIVADAKAQGLADILLTGGDAGHLLALGLPCVHRPDLVLSGLRAIHAEDLPE